ncbi:hypothetical protein CsSME_00052296 [Camellia sinensis var. sinensis]
MFPFFFDCHVREFPVRLENPRVISANQIWAGVVSAGLSSYSFNSSYRSCDSVEYMLELGNAIVNFAQIVPDGLLVFFPSYYLLDQCIGYWKNMVRVPAQVVKIYDLFAFYLDAPFFLLSRFIQTQQFPAQSGRESANISKLL